MGAVNTSQQVPPAPAPGAAGDEMSTPEAVMRRVLRAPVTTRADEAGAYRLFSSSILLSAARCLLSYVIFPIAALLVAVSVTTKAAIGLPLTVLAVVFDIRAVRRFWLADHRWKWVMTGVYAVIMVLVISLAVQEIAAL
jgi:hypothetical protein